MDIDMPYSHCDFKKIMIDEVWEVNELFRPPILFYKKHRASWEDGQHTS